MESISDLRHKMGAQFPHSRKKLHVHTFQSQIQKGDVMIFMNYRADRARQITQAFTDESFQGFPRGTFAQIQFVCLIV
jgi:bisphosphoglycerate-independent phosphoglycerate mutase (AlkP superfamily)